MPYKKFFAAKTTTGAGTAYQWLGGMGTVTANGFGSSGAVTLQMSPASSTGPFVTSSTDAILNAASTAQAFNFQMNPGIWIRPIVTVASTTGINYWLH